VTPLSWLLLATHVPATGQLGGMVRYVMELARELARHPDVSLSVLTVRPTRPVFAELLGDEQRVLTLPALHTAARSLLEHPGVGVPAFRRPFDVVHGTKHLVPRWSAGRRVLTVHDLVPMDRPQDFSPLKRRALVAPYRASLRAADVLVCVSEATRTRLLADQPSTAGRTAVVPLAMSTALREATAQAVPQLAGRRFALVVGDASPRKNLGQVVDSWEQVVRTDPDAVLAVVGPRGWGVDERGQRFDELVARGAVLPLGRVNDGVLRWLYEHARVVACPSLLEGFGLPSVEALHFGAPLLTSTDPALVEASGDAAVHLRPDDRAGWVAALSRGLAQPRPAAAAGASRTWADVADETVQAVARAVRS
jgi:glycosyltransferase involved in cell wall biosynthesis